MQAHRTLTIVEAKTASVVSEYEARIDKLERQKTVISERLDQAVPLRGRLEDCIELAQISYQALGIYTKMETT